MTKMSYLSLICHTLFMSRCTKIRSIIDTAELNDLYQFYIMDNSMQ